MVFILGMCCFVRWTLLSGQTQRNYFWCEGVFVCVCVCVCVWCWFCVCGCVCVCVCVCLSSRGDGDMWSGEEAFWGCWQEDVCVGGYLVPLYPPQRLERASHAERPATAAAAVGVEVAKEGLIWGDGF